MPPIHQQSLYHMLGALEELAQLRAHVIVAEQEGNYDLAAEANHHYQGLLESFKQMMYEQQYLYAQPVYYLSKDPAHAAYNTGLNPKQDDMTIAAIDKTMKDYYTDPENHPVIDPGKKISPGEKISAIGFPPYMPWNPTTNSWEQAIMEAWEGCEYGKVKRPKKEVPEPKFVYDPFLEEREI